jgi:glycosyltransferase involved in cell wall biosynthesis
VNPRSLKPRPSGSTCTFFSATSDSCSASASIVQSFASKVITVPVGGESYAALNEFTAAWLECEWGALFADSDTPEMAIIGGWPFFEAIPLLEARGCATVFMDCGAVPSASYTGVAREIQDKVRALRRRNLPRLSLVTPISDFIARSQSEADAPGVDVRPILLGADHMELAIWGSDNVDAKRQATSGYPFASIDPKPLLVSLGRWEPGCYKKSEEVFAFVDRLRPTLKAFALAVLAEPDEIEIAPQYRDHVIAVGHPDDRELQSLMRAAALGVSFSTWEGFNLPLAEMQWLRRPVLALDAGAHAQVIAHPWFLCRDVEEMATRAAEVLQGRGPDREDVEAAQRRFATRFRWERTVDEYEQALFELRGRRRGRRPLVWIDVSNAARDDANTGVVRVTRRIARELQRYCDPRFVVWSAERGEYVAPNLREYQLLAAYNGPVIAPDAPRSSDRQRMAMKVAPGDGSEPRWLFLTETVLESNGRAIRGFAASNRFRTAAVFYDAIPVLRPDLVKDEVIRENHAAYMAGLADCDVVMPISEFSERCLRDLWQERGLAGRYVRAHLLPGEFSGSSRQTTAHTPSPAVSILCVSTLEPRKNHASLIDAFRRFARGEHRDATLTLIGNRYAGGDAITRNVMEACANDARIQWLGVVDDAMLHRAYMQCTFTVYASEIEGFGMPVLESLWHGKPCICHREGVMAELAAEGGCITADVTDSAALSDAVERLAVDRGLYSTLVQQALDRPMKTWGDYALEMVRTLEMQGTTSARSARERAAADREGPVRIEDLLYPACLTKDWQMNESERLGMMAVLHRLKPTCAIEVGTYKGGSLSLLAQYAKAVFSIDIDPTIPERLRQFANVSFLTGPSGEILPTLLRELDDAGMPVEFVLIDGDHSTEGVRRDIEIMLDYVPKKRLLMMLHDGFNPDCRRGMQEARWERSPHVQWVDLDFIPGRVVEHGGGGDGGMWGGLAMALLTPAPRNGPLNVDASSKRMFAELKERHHA